MGIINTGKIPKAVAVGVEEWYGNAYNEYKPEYPEIFKKYIPPKGSFMEDVGLTGFGLAQAIPEGDSVTYDETEQGYTYRYTYVEYGLGFIITYTMYEDNRYATIGLNKATALAFSMRQTKDVVAANVLNRAFTAAYAYGDGKELCADDHPNKTGGTWRNKLSVAADLSEVALEQAIIDISDFETDRGLKIKVLPKKLIIAPSNEFNAIRILKSTLQSDSAENNINALRVSGRLTGGTVVNHFLTDADAWFITTDCPVGMKYVERRADAFGQDNDFDTSNMKFKATGRYAFGCSDPRSIFGSPGA